MRYLKIATALETNLNVKVLGDFQYISEITEEIMSMSETPSISEETIYSGAFVDDDPFADIYEDTSINMDHSAFSLLSRESKVKEVSFKLII